MKILPRLINFQIALLFCVLSSLLSFQSKTYAQNLIPNPSFEQYTSLPSQKGMADSALYWYQPNMASADYFHMDAIGFDVGVPQNYQGNRSAQDGKAYVGSQINAYNKAVEYNEYLSVELKETLKRKGLYSVTFYCSSSDYNDYEVSNFGVLFTQDSVVEKTFFLERSPQWENDTSNFVNSKNGWKKFTFQFRPDSEFNFFTIGNFNKTKDCVVSKIPVFTDRSRTYLYFDNFELIKIRDPIELRGDTSVCAGHSDSVILTASGGDSTFIWEYADIPGYVISKKNKLTVRPHSTTTYLVYNLIGDSCTITVEVNPIPRFSLGNDTSLCSNETLELSSKLPKDLLKESSWQNQSTNYFFEAEFQDTLVWLEVIDTNNCVYRDSISINWRKQPTLITSKDTLICSGDKALLTAQGGLSIAWKDEKGGVLSSLNSFEVAPDTTAYFFVQAEENNCLSPLDSVLVLIKEIPSLDISENQSICLGGQAKIFASGGNQIQWFDGETSAQRTVSPNSDAWYKVRAVDQPCSSDWDSIKVLVDTMPLVASFIASPDSGSAPLPVKFINKSDSADSYHWNWGDGGQLTYSFLDDQQSNREYNHTYQSANNYTVSLDVSRNSGCTDQAEGRVFVSKDFIIHIPNVFSPNEDNLNDKFEIFVKPGNTTTGQIYNRWGEKIHTFEYPEEPFWDGKIRGHPLPPGTYLYRLEVTEPDHLRHYYSGEVLIVR